MTGSDNAAPFASIAEEPQSDPFAASAFDQPPPIDDNTGVELVIHDDDYIEGRS